MPDLVPKDPTREQFSVVIPTLQMSPLLPQLVATYNEHSRVGEIIIVNNAAHPLDLEGSKLRVLDQTRNIFVNPAWNAGASAARFPLLAISNDDIDIDGPLLDAAASRLSSRRIGIIGGDLSHPRARSGRPRFRPVFRRPEGFGVLMLMRTENYTPIPERLKIWQGDDYLFHRQSGRNFVFRGFRLDTPHHVTANRPEFSQQKKDDFQHYMDRYHTESVYWRRRSPDFLALRAAVALHRRFRPLPTTWDSRRGSPQSRD